MEHFRFPSDVEKLLVLMLLKFYQNLENNPQNPATLYRKRQKKERLGFCQLVFLFQQSEPSVVENEKNFASVDNFLIDNIYFGNSELFFFMKQIAVPFPCKL